MGLDADQQSALELVKAGANVCMTGEGGAGKTFTLREAHAALVRRFPGRGEVAVCASIGPAAQNMKLDANTVHAVFHLGMASGTADSIVKRIQKKRGAVASIRRYKAAIIDEVSALSAQFLTKLSAVLCHVRRDARPMGGLELLLVGDFLQTRPVGGPDDPNPGYIFESEVWPLLRMRYVLLRNQHRQRDTELLFLMRRLRALGYDPEVRAELFKLTDGNNPADFEGPEVVHVFATNEEVDAYNREAMRQLRGRVFESDSEDWVAPGYLEPRLRGEPAAVATRRLCDTFFERTPRLVALRAGTQVIVTVNLDPPDYVNGTQGVVTEFRETLSKGARLFLPVVRFRSGACRSVSLHTVTHYENSEPVARRTQIPLRPSFALTVHKCLGLTLDRVVLHLERVRAFDQLYVALTRTRDRTRMLIKSLPIGCMCVPARVLDFLRSAFGLDEADRLDATLMDVVDERAAQDKKRQDPPAAVPPSKRPRDEHASADPPTKRPRDEHASAVPPSKRPRDEHASAAPPSVASPAP
jgi:ATP-dependent DNA helicase PIF1